MATQTAIQNITSGSNLLRLSLRADGAFTALAGLDLIIWATPIASFMGIDAPLALEVLGGILVLCGAIMLWMAAQPRIDRRFAFTNVLVNDAWVAASVLLLLTNWISFSSEGKWVVGLVAALVAVFGSLEFYGLRRTK